MASCMHYTNRDYGRDGGRALPLSGHRRRASETLLERLLALSLRRGGRRIDYFLFLQSPKTILFPPRLSELSDKYTLDNEYLRAIAAASRHMWSLFVCVSPSPLRPAVELVPLGCTTSPSPLYMTGLLLTHTCSLIMLCSLL